MSSNRVVVCAVLLLGGCALSTTWTSSQIAAQGTLHRLPEQYGAPCATPLEAAPMQALDAVDRVGTLPDHCQPGTFVLTVHRIDAAEGRLWLDSETNYRRPDNLAISVSPQAMDELALAFGQSPQTLLWDRRIIVKGVARRIRIRIFDVHCPGCFYYQTHVPVDDAAQIQIAGLVRQGEPQPVGGALH